MKLEEAQAKARALFEGIASAEAEEVSLVEVGRREMEAETATDANLFVAMTPPGFPIPALLFFGLTRLLGLPLAEEMEKVRWGVFFSLRGSTFGFEDRKFGLRALTEPRNLDSPILREVLGKAKALVDLVEAHLAAEVIKDQLATSNATMVNLYDSLEERYRFLRAEAERVYATPPPSPLITKTQHGTTYEHDRLKPQREGGAMGSAAVDAYFSLLEHLFALATAFVPKSLPPAGIVEFLGWNWGAKAKAVLDLTNPSAKSFYARFIEVRLDWRNPIAHGGFLERGGSLYFHLDGVGALPARLRRSPEGMRAGFIPHNETFAQMTELFDRFDVFLRDEALRHAVKWARSGLDVAFDNSSRARYQAAMASDEDFDYLIEGTHKWHDNAANLD